MPINFTGDLPNQQVGSDVGEDIDGWFGGLLPDWETTGPALKFIYDLIPLVGDGTEVIVQTVNYFTGKGVDEVSATLAAIGFALDFPTDPVTVAAGGVVSGAKIFYNLSKKGAGTFAKVISDIVLGPGRPLQKVQLLRDAVGTFVDVLLEGRRINVDAFGNADEVASALAQASGKSAADAVGDLGNAVEYAQSIGVSGREFLELATTTRANVDKIQLNQVVDWLGSGRLTKVSEDVYESAEGLRYTPGAAEGHHIAHVLKHSDEAAAGTNKAHGVFNSNENIIDVIDEAWSIKKANNIPPISPQDLWGFNITMPRVIGYSGGPAGTGNDTSVIRIVVNPATDEIVTAYPIEP